MEYRKLGRSGLNISTLILGTMNFGNPTNETESVKIIDAAIDAGINLIDCANIYAGGESERILGRILHLNGKRKKVLLTTKAFFPSGPGPNEKGNSRHNIIESCHKSLKQLNTDYIDIFFLHRTDLSVPQEETLSALDLLVNQGKIRHIGCSTHPPWRTVEALYLSDKYGYPKFTCEQPPYNLLDRRIENEIVPMCEAFNLGIISWSPLAQGVLAGKYNSARILPKGSRGTQKNVFAERITEQGINTSISLAGYLQQKNKNLVPFSVAWVLKQKNITGAIIGPRTFKQFQELLEAENTVVDKEDLDFCDSLVPQGHFVSNHFNTSGWMK